VIRTANHDHQPNDRAVSKELITLRLVDKCKHDPSIPTKRVYDTVVDNLTDYDSDDAPTFKYRSFPSELCHNIVNYIPFNDVL
jgi:hypothetical protein